MTESDHLDFVLEAVLPPKVRRQTVWHYTKPDTARLIIESRAFWATAVNAMNDRSEMVYGMALVRKIWARRRDASPNAERIDRWIYLAEVELHGERKADSYILCASTEEDSFVQWNSYGHCALGITTDMPMTKRPVPNNSGGRLGPTFTTGWRAVLYDQIKQEEHVSQLLEALEHLCSLQTWDRRVAMNTLDESGIECVLRAIVYLKSPEFAPEREVRLYGQAKATGALVEEHNNAFGPSSHIFVRSRVALDGLEDVLPIVGVRIADTMPEVRAEAALLQARLDNEPGQVQVVVVPTNLRMPSRIAPS
jgi:hypothetical protein